MELIKTDSKNLDIINEFTEKISQVNEKVCVFGQGFVGLPLTLSFAFRGCKTLGVDVDDILISQTNKGITHHTEEFKGVTIQEILRMELDNKRYKATTNGAKAVKECNNIIVTVGIPIKDGKYIMEYLESACRTIGQNLKKGDLVIIRSTVIPGTTEDFCLPILEKESRLKAGEEFYLAYASERIAEGFAFYEFANMPTLVGGINEVSLKRATEVLKIVCKADIIPSNCIKAVETSKVFENVQRDVNIAMAQEFARFTEKLGIDIFEVVKLANTHKRVNILTPGPGVGGYCIPNAYHYIAPKAKELGIEMDLLSLAREKNASLPEFIVSKAENLLKKCGKDIKNSKIAVLGLAMKDYSNDDRISPPIDICNLLIKKGANVQAFDPVVPTVYNFKVNTQEQCLEGADIVLILAKQHEIEFNIEKMSELIKMDTILIDTRNVIDIDRAIEKGLRCWKI